jgi:lipoic acid synthetase
MESSQNLKIPAWIKARFRPDDNYRASRELIKKARLNSVCIEADCPNRSVCWAEKHITFMLLGKQCTRACLFCNVRGGAPVPPDNEEPERVARAVKELGKKYIVLTSVTRDDLPDRGSGHFARTVRAVKELLPSAEVELLIPDMGAKEELIIECTASGACVAGHNIETVKRLYPGIRPAADYERSLKVLDIISDQKNTKFILSKSSMMLGLGEGLDEIYRTFGDLLGAGVDILYLGQYLSPSREHVPVRKYYTPDEFASLEDKARQMGFRSVCSAPMARSSFRAREAYLEAREKKQEL